MSDVDVMGCPCCGHPQVSMFEHLKAAHRGEDWGQFSSRRLPTNGHGQVVIGLTRRIAYALAVHPLSDVPRSFVRSVLPEKSREVSASSRVGGGGRYESYTSRELLNILRKFEKLGSVARIGEHVRVLRRDELWECATREVGEARVEWISIERAVQPAREAVRAARVEADKQRALRELQAVYELMKHDVGVWTGDRRQVRHVPHGWRGRPS